MTLVARLKIMLKDVEPQVLDATPGLSYPRLLKASGACPPGDVGGPWS
jgi:hypothetical protein